MKPLSIIVVVLACVMLAGLCVPAAAAKATPDEALALAARWVATVVAEQGHWGGSPAAEVDGVQPLEAKNRLLGYFCPVRPSGYVVVSLHKELAPVKAWSDTSDLDPAAEGGMAALIRESLDRMIQAVEKKTGKKIDAATDEEIGKVLEINYRKSWDQQAALENEPDAIGILANYTSGNILLTSSWHQAWPYNDQCPYLGCTEPALRGRAWVGCVATAGTQVMHYWAWPPSYSWPNIPDDLTGSSPLADINETARLCHNIGVQAGMDYGCDGSATLTSNMVVVYVANGYSLSGADSTCHVENRATYSADIWFDIIRNQLNVNRPIQYRVKDHSIVCDGWRIQTGVKQYHMNYGWNSGHNTWYTLDALHLGDPPNEYIVTDIVPIRAIHGTISGTYPTDTSFPYRYFDRDSAGSSATFNPGHLLQFLPDITATCTGAAGSAIRFTGSADQHTRLFARGDTSRGVVIRNAVIRLNPNGELALR